MQQIHTAAAASAAAAATAALLFLKLTSIGNGAATEFAYRCLPTADSLLLRPMMYRTFDKFGCYPAGPQRNASACDSSINLSTAAYSVPRNRHDRWL